MKISRQVLRNTFSSTLHSVAFLVAAKIQLSKQNNEVLITSCLSCIEKPLHQAASLSLHFFSAGWLREVAN